MTFRPANPSRDNCTDNGTDRPAKHKTAGGM